MELKEFIKETITEVVLAVKESQEDLEGTSVIINPSSVADENYVDINGRGRRLITDIVFDIAVTTENSEGERAGVSVIAGAFGFGKVSKINEKDVAFNKIQLKIPVSLPISDDLNEITEIKKRIEEKKKKSSWISI